MAGRPIVILDTSVFIQDALSPEQKGAASQLLAIIPVVAHVVMCMEARAELLEKLSGFGWSVDDVEARYGPIFNAAIWVEPVEEGPHHLKAVANDRDDTKFVRAAEAVYVTAPEIDRGAGALRREREHEALPTRDRLRRLSLRHTTYRAEDPLTGGPPPVDSTGSSIHRLTVMSGRAKGSTSWASAGLAFKLPALAQAGVDVRSPRIVLVSRSGFTPGLVEAAESDQRIRLVDVPTLVSG